MTTDVQRLSGPGGLRLDPVWRFWLLAWLGGAFVGIANGALRELLVADRLGEGAARRVSVATGIALFALYFVLLDRLRPLPTLRTALAIGLAWVVLTVTFEFTFGHWVEGKSWETLLADYDLLAGNLWIFMLAWLGIGPAVVRRLRR